jgi:DNA-binding MarR family transcriptional regulator
VVHQFNLVFLIEYPELAMEFSLCRRAQRLSSTTMAHDDEPDVQVEGWLKTLGIESLCQWDVLVFQYRHQSSLVSAEHIARFLGYGTAEVVAALDSLESSGLVERSRVSQGVRLYEVTALADPARRDVLARLMALADSHTVRSLLAGRRGGANDLTGTKRFPFGWAKGREHD